MYFVRRDGRVKGPLERDRLVSLRAEKRLRGDDEIATSAAGPWRILRDCHDEVLGMPRSRDGRGVAGDPPTPSRREQPAAASAAAGDSSAGGLFTDESSDEFVLDMDDGSPAESGWEADDGSARPGREAAGRREAPRPSAADVPPTETAAGVAPGQAALARLLGSPSLVGAAIVATALVSAGAAFLLTVWLGIAAPEHEEQRTRELTGELNTAKPAPKPTAPADGAEKARPAARRPAARPAAASADSDGAANDAADELAAAPPAAARLAIEKPVDPAADQVAAVKSLLDGYYKAADWPSRYRLAVPGEPVKRMMRLLYADTDWVAVEWGFSKPPAQDELVAAARAQKPVRIDTVLNGNPHQIFVTWADGGWRVDWLQSLETLWLTK